MFSFLSDVSSNQPMFYNNQSGSGPQPIASNNSNNTGNRAGVNLGMPQFQNQPGPNYPTLPENNPQPLRPDANNNANTNPNVNNNNRVNNNAPSGPLLDPGRTSKN